MGGRIYRKRADACGLEPYERGLVEGYIVGAEEAEVQRQKIGDNPRDPSWTEHCAEISSRLYAMASRICYDAEQRRVG